MQDEFNQQSEETIQELSFSDKFVGILNEPTATFENISNTGSKTSDWLAPFGLLLILVIVSQIVIMMNPEIKLKVQEERMEQIRKQFDKMVEEGTLSRQQADDQLEKTEEQMEKFSGTVGKIIMAISILIFGFITFFIICGIHFLVVKFILKGEGSYRDVMAANGLISYIIMIQVILYTILSLIMNEYLRDTSLANFLTTEKGTITHFLLSKIDPITIWAYIVLGIGLSKLFKSNDSQKYIAAILAVWILGGLLLFGLSKTVPFLANFS